MAMTPNGLMEYDILARIYVRNATNWLDRIWKMSDSTRAFSGDTQTIRAETGARRRERINLALAG